MPKRIRQQSCPAFFLFQKSMDSKITKNSLVVYLRRMFVLLYQIGENLSPFIQTDPHPSGRVTDFQIVGNRFG